MSRTARSPALLAARGTARGRGTPGTIVVTLFVPLVLATCRAVAANPSKLGHHLENYDWASSCAAMNGPRSLQRQHILSAWRMAARQLAPQVKSGRMQVISSRMRAVGSACLVRSDAGGAHPRNGISLVEPGRNMRHWGLARVRTCSHTVPGHARARPTGVMQGGMRPAQQSPYSSVYTPFCAQAQHEQTGSFPSTKDLLKLFAPPVPG